MDSPRETNGTEGAVDFRSKAVGLGNAAADLQNEAVKTDIRSMSDGRSGQTNGKAKITLRMGGGGSARHLMSKPEDVV